MATLSTKGMSAENPVIAAFRRPDFVGTADLGRSIVSGNDRELVLPCVKE